MLNQREHVAAIMGAKHADPRGRDVSQNGSSRSVSCRSGSDDPPVARNGDDGERVRGARGSEVSGEAAEARETPRVGREIDLPVVRVVPDEVPAVRPDDSGQHAAPVREVSVDSGYDPDLGF